MLVRQLGRVFRNTVRFDIRYFSTEPSTSEKHVNPIQVVYRNKALDKDLCLLVDEKDNFLGPTTKRQCHKVSPDGKVLLHRAFSVFVFNERGDILIQRRASHKVTYPNYYTNACCSHPLFLNENPEDVITAAMRRMTVELGIHPDQMSPEMFTHMTRVHYMDTGDGVWGEHEVDHILVFQNQVNLKPNPDEISEITFVPRNEFDAFMSTLDGPITPWFDYIRKHRLKLWWDNLHRLPELAEPNKVHKLDE